jgi:multidrug transporter EmrE-like cation transporter
MAKKEKTDKRVYLALHLLLVFYSLSSVLSKLAAAESFLSFRFCLYYGGMFVILVVYALGWQQILKRLPLTVAFANKAVTLVWSIVFGALLFHETIRLTQLIGCALAVVGVILFVQPESDEKEAAQ